MTASTASSRPPRLVLRFALYSALAMLLAGGGILWFVRHEAQIAAEQELAKDATRAAAMLGGKLEPRDLEAPIRNPERLRAVDALFALEQQQGVVRIKLWRPDGTVTYSTDHSLIGSQLDADELEHVLSGEVIREIGHLNDEGGTGENIKVLSAYVPLKLSGEQRPRAVLEFYNDYAPIDARVAATVKPVALALFLALLLLFASLFPILRQVTKALEQRNRRLEQQAAELEKTLTERRQAVAGLREAETRYRALVEQLPLVTYIDRLDAWSSSIFMSPQIERILGYPVQDWLDDPQFFPKVLHPEDRDRVLAEHAEAQRTGDSFSSQYRMIANDGRVVWFEDVLTIVRDENGTPVQAQGFLLDISHRKATELALSDSEERFRTLVGNVPGVIFRCAIDSDWTMEFLSDEVEELVGYPASDFIQNEVRTYASVVHPEDAALLEREVDEAVKADRPYTTEYRVIHRDGGVRHVVERGQAILGRDGEYKLDGAIFDLTERRQRDEELRRQTAVVELLEVIAVAANESPDVEQAMQVCVDRVCAHTEWPVGHVYVTEGSDPPELASAPIWHLENPSELAAFKAVTEATRLAPGVGLPGRVLASGRPLWVTDVTNDPNFPRAESATEAGLRAGFAFPVLVGAEVAAVLEFFSREEVPPDAALLDVMSNIGTQLGRAIERERANAVLRKSEARHRTIIETANDAFIAIDASGAITDWNPQAELTFGWTRDEAVGLLLSETIIPPQYREAHTRGLERFLATSEEHVLFKPIELTALHRDGREFPVELKIWPVQADDGYRFNAFARDITERKQTEAERERFVEELAAQNERLRELDRLKDEFVALVSHELRTPLTSIRGYLELVLEGEAGDLTDEQRQFLGVVERNAHRLLALVGDLLFLAQVEAGKLSLEIGAVDLSSIAAETVETARPLAEEKGVTLTLASGPLALLAGDRGRLAQLLDNLVSNGVKFTPSGGRVDVRVRGERGTAVIEVRDTGMGIPASEQEHLFERFFRTSKATEQAIPGTGLGLAISKAIVHAHGGQITVSSDEGSGATFRVGLPIRQTQVEPAEAEEVAL